MSQSPYFQSKKISVAPLLSLFILLVLLLSSPLVIPALPAAGASSSLNNNAAPLAVTNAVSVQKDRSAGYEIYSSTSGQVVSVQANWTVPTVKCAAYSSLQVGIFAAHIYSDDSGSFVVIGCNGAGATPGYTIYYMGNNFGDNPLPSGDTVSASDKMYTQASVDPLGGETSVFIQDLTKHWTFSNAGNEPIDTTQAGTVWLYIGSANSGTTSEPLPQFSTETFGHVKTTINGHTGSIGSFISGFTIYKLIFIDTSNQHVLAKPTSITSSSTGFKVKWVQGS